MAEQLTIRNFGPIRKAQIEVRNLTVFVGPQATGKSMAAQVLYFMRGLEDLSSRPVDSFRDGKRRGHQPSEDAQVMPDTDTPLEATIAALEWWLGNEASVYTTSSTVLSWNPEVPSRRTKYEIRWDEKGARLGEILKKRVQEWSSPPKLQVYIPAGRALYSFLPSATALRFLLSPGRVRLKWPGYILTFYEALGGAIDELWRDQEQWRYSEEELFEPTIDARFLQQRIEAIFKEQIRYGPDSVSLKIGQKVLHVETIAAGQMEIWPFWAILQETLKSGTFDRTRIYFEEPEAHLHPGAQRSVMEIIAYLVNQGGQFVITTHSPYILYAINNSLMARKVLDKGHNLPREIPRQIALRPEQVAAYRFSPDGQVHDIMDVETGLIDEHELDQVADELGATFTSLQEQMEDIG